jgi:hypothetical protein
MPRKAQRGGKDMAPTHFKTPKLERVGGQRHAQDVLPAESTRYPSYRVLGRPGPFWTGMKKSLAHGGSMPGQSSP